MITYRHSIWGIIGLVLLLFVLRPKPRQGDTISVDASDPEMNAAIAKARSTLPHFWEAFDKREHDETDFALKVRITEGKEVEYFWAIDIQKENGRILGTINNDPEWVHNIKIGQRITIPEVDVSDWLFQRDGKMIGNYTLRALFKKMSPAEVEKYKRMMVNP